MGRHNYSPVWQFTITAILIGSLIAGVGIVLGVSAGTYARPSWMPQGPGDQISVSNWTKFSSNPNYTAEMVIITSEDLEPALMPLAQCTTQEGTPCIIITTEQIYSNPSYAGRDQPEEIRNCLRDLYYNGSLQWVLLAGNETTVPTRYVWNPDTVQVPNNELAGSDLDLKPTDYYYSALAGDWYNPADGRWGESANQSGSIDFIDWTPDVYVGRFPANSFTDMQIMVNKTIQYMIDPSVGPWMDNMLLAAAISDPSPLNNDEAYVVQKIADSYVPSSMQKTFLFRTTSAYAPAPDTYNLSTSAFAAAIDAGQSLVHFEGHGNYNELASWASDNSAQGEIAALDVPTAEGLTNYNEPSFFYTAACDSAAFDIYPTSTLMYALLDSATAGAIGYVGVMRVSWYFDLSVEQAAGEWLDSLNRGLAQAFWENFFVNGTHQPGKALADAKLTYMNSSWAAYQNANNSVSGGFFDWEYERKELLSYTLFGDPEINIYTQEPNTFQVKFPTTIYGGEQVQVPIEDNYGNVVQGATVCYQSGNLYNNTHLGTSDTVTTRFPQQAANYTVTITAPNMLPDVFNITVKQDTSKPQVLSQPTLSCVGEHGTAGTYTVDDAFNFTVCAQDCQSGIGVVAMHLSYDNFATMANYSLNASSGNQYSTLVDHLPPGTADYYFDVISCAGNTETILPVSGGYFTITVVPLTIHYVIGGLGLIAGGIALIVFITGSWRRWSAWKKELLQIDGGREIEPDLQPGSSEKYDFV
jgi:hypothetical protein